VAKKRTYVRNQPTRTIGMQEMNIQDSHNKAVNVSYASVTYIEYTNNLQKVCTPSIRITKPFLVLSCPV
jgi:hypothetical protein